MTYFTYNGRSSADFGLHIEKKDVFSAPEYDAEFISIPGRSGDIINPNRRFANIKVTYTVFLARKNVAALASDLRDIKGWLYSEPDRYHELTDSYDAEYFRYGVISGSLDIEEQLSKVGSFRYPFGGQKSEFAYHGEWVHNLWLDILNKVGLIPFVIAVIFTITSIRSAYGAAVRMKKANHNLLSNQIASLGLGALLICMPEPVVDANPYFFFAILMLLGGIKGVECSFGKEDTAESERGF